MRVRKLLAAISLMFMPLIIGSVMVGTATVVTSCNNAAYKVHPGAVNAFDSQVYDVLVAADAAIQQTKTQLSSGAFTNPTVAHDVAIALNGAITAYNVADNTYLQYHAAAAAIPPTATPAQANALQSQIAGLTTAVSNLNVAKGGK